MRFPQLLRSAALLGSLSNSLAFVVTDSVPRSRLSTSIWSSPFGGSGWENDSFLDSLSSDEGNDQTFASANSRPEEEWQYIESEQPLSVMTQQMPSSGLEAAYTSQEQQWYGTQGQGQHDSELQQQQQEPGGGVLPFGWTEHFDAGSGRPYYYNTNDGTTTWDRPGQESSMIVPSFPDQSSSAEYQGIPSNFQQQPSMWGSSSSNTMGENALNVPQGEELPTDDIEGAILTEEMKAKAKASHNEEEEASQGGSKFRAMIERGKHVQQSGTVPVGLGVQQVQMPAYAKDLPFEEYTRLYNEMAWRQNNALRLAGPQQAYLPPGTGIDGRKIGRNRDSEVISNEADAYFARLKRDSTLRVLARHSGDDVTANSVLNDPSIADIKAPELNPYLKERRERERNMLDTVPEEMLLFQEYDQPDEEVSTDSGISYKEKLAYALQRRGRAAS